MAPPPPADALRSLDALIQTASTLLTRLRDALSDIQKDAAAPPPPAQAESPDGSPAPLDVLGLAHDSATLIRAHATKISLLIINEPFSPTALSTVVRELLSGAAPAMAAAPQACDPTRYTATVRRELAQQCQRVLAELQALLLRIPRDGRALTGGKEASIQVTGILWSACDDVVKLTKRGPAGIFADKTRQWEDMLKDVLEELKEWGEDEADDSDSDESGENGDVDGLADRLGDAKLSAQDMIDDLMDSHQSIPRDDPDHIRPRLESTMKRLRLVTLLYGAARVRRFNRLPALPPAPAQSELPRRLDELARALQKLPESFEDLAAAFYELDADEVDAAMRACFGDALAISELLAKDWTGADDAFSQWVQRFQAEIKLPA